MSPSINSLLNDLRSSVVDKTEVAHRMVQGVFVSKLSRNADYHDSSSYIGPKSLWRRYIITTIVFADTIHRPIFI
jgi:hypothetical protein